MAERIEFIVATTGRKNIGFIEGMNISAPVIVLNQCGEYRTQQSGQTIMISTPTHGVGINRNIGLSLTEAEYAFIVDDDMVFYDNAETILRNAIKEHPDADVIIFNFDYMKGTEKIRSRILKPKRIKYYNCLKFGICCALVKTARVKQKNISFTTLFGGGCIYGSGEDSLFYLECVRKKLKIYTCAVSVGMNVYRESTWFKGYNDKFFYDKGAWIACAFPYTKHLIKWHWLMRLRKNTNLPAKTVLRRLSQGISGYKHLEPYKAHESKEMSV